MALRIIEISHPEGGSTFRHRAECDTCHRVFDTGDHQSWETAEEAIAAALAFDWQQFEDDTIHCAVCTTLRLAE